MKFKKNKKDLVYAFFITLVGVFIAHLLSDITGIEALATREGIEGILGWAYLFVYYFVFVFLIIKVLDYFKK